LKIQRRQRFAAGYDRYAAQTRQQRDQCGLDLKNNLSTQMLDHRQIAHELQNITDALLREQQKLATNKFLAILLRTAASLQIIEASTSPTIIGKTVLEITVDQEQM
jgi:hypothetical protein